jgi:hypothetical protein
MVLRAGEYAGEVAAAPNRALKRPRGITGELVPAEVIQDLPRLDVTRMPKVKEMLP